MEFILFHSEECPHCVAFIKQMTKYSTQLDAAQISVLKINDPVALQKYGIKVVPTILTPGQQRLEGNAAFNWLEQFSPSSNSNESSSSQSSESSNKRYLRLLIYAAVGATVSYFVYKKVSSTFFSKSPPIPVVESS